MSRVLRMRPLVAVTIFLLTAYLTFKLFCIYTSIIQHELLYQSRADKLDSDIGNLFINNNPYHRFPVYASWMTSPVSKEVTNPNDVINPQGKEILVKYSTCQGHYWLIVLIKSDLTRFNERMVIRKTWGRWQKATLIEKWRIFFLLSKSTDQQDALLLEDEIEKFGDIVYLDEVINRNEETVVLQTAIKWSTTYCDFDYLMKVEDNVFFNVHSLWKFFNETHRHHTLYMGYVNFNTLVSRTGQFAVSREDYPKERFARYCSGSGYILSLDAVMKMVNNFDKIKAFHVSDAYIGELALLSGIDVRHNTNFKIFENPQRCIFNAEAIIHRPVSSTSCMEKLYKKGEELILV